MLPDLLQQFTGAWHESLHRAGVCLEPPLSAIQLGGARGQDRKVNFLVFQRGARHPVLILKVARSPRYQRRLQQEFQALQDVARLDAMQGTVSSPIGLFQWDKHVVMAESCLVGTPLSVFLRRHERLARRKMVADLHCAQDWLTRFQAATTTGTWTFPGRAAVDERLTHLDAPTGLPPCALDTLRSLAESYAGLPLPLTGSHGDFWPANVLLTPQGIGVIDWEHFRRDQLPFNDALLFITAYAQTYPWDGWRWPSKTRAFQRAFLEKNWFSELVVAYVHCYLRTIQVPESAAHLFFALFLMDMVALARTDGDRGESRRRIWMDLFRLYALNATQSVWT